MQEVKVGKNSLCRSVSPAVPPYSSPGFTTTQRLFAFKGRLPRSCGWLSRWTWRTTGTSFPSTARRSRCSSSCLRHLEIEELFAPIAAQLDDRSLRELNAAVDIDGLPVRDEVVPALVEVEVAVPRSMPAVR